ncbi:hypothetical protein EOA32_13370 [Mesorhizobium sp. M1A.F.Ca.ET.072.01.1.1]|nr:hypothetical protein EOA32_13370 [Mesorhizobium sp. M1A.F.Ca.ET.072.01.1.1]TIV02508.1 MAG: hypothetical protein E5W04_13035 [Mesorhizobium sp.]
MRQHMLNGWLVAALLALACLLGITAYVEVKKRAPAHSVDAWPRGGAESGSDARNLLLGAAWQYHVKSLNGRLRRDQSRQGRAGH